MNSFKRNLLISSIVLALCGVSISSPTNAEGIQITDQQKDKFYSIPDGGLQYQQSLGPNHVFSKMFIEQNDGYNFAGMSFVWINGAPFLTPIYWPREDLVHQQFPWLAYPPSTVPSACQFEPWNCK